MSFILEKQVREIQGLSRAMKAVLLALAHFANDVGLAFPAVATVAQHTGYSERSVQYALRRLEKTDWIRQQARTRQHRTNRMFINVLKVNTPANTGLFSFPGPFLTGDL